MGKKSRPSLRRSAGNQWPSLFATAAISAMKSARMRSRADLSGARRIAAGCHVAIVQSHHGDLITSASLNTSSSSFPAGGERTAFQVFAISGLLADQHCTRRLRALAKDGLCRKLRQVAALAPGRGLRQGRQVESLRKVISGSHRLVSGSDRATSAALVTIRWPSGQRSRDSPRTWSDEFLILHFVALVPCRTFPAVGCVRSPRSVGRRPSPARGPPPLSSYARRCSS